jgi:ketosteroid isomerase-like protein
MSWATASLYMMSGRLANIAAGTTIVDWKQLFAGFKDNPSFEIVDFGMTIDGDVAFTHGAQRITVNTGKARTTVVVRVTDVLRKINGKWLIVQEHVSVPVDLDTMKPDPLSKP